MLAEFSIVVDFQGIWTDEREAVFQTAADRHVLNQELSECFYELAPNRFLRGLPHIRCSSLVPMNALRIN